MFSDLEEISTDKNTKYNLLAQLDPSSGNEESNQSEENGSSEQNENQGDDNTGTNQNQATEQSGQETSQESNEENSNEAKSNSLDTSDLNDNLDTTANENKDQSNIPGASLPPASATSEKPPEETSLPKEKISHNTFLDITPCSKSEGSTNIYLKKVGLKTNLNPAAIKLEKITTNDLLIANKPQGLVILQGSSQDPYINTEGQIKISTSSLVSDSSVLAVHDINKDGVADIFISSEDSINTILRKENNQTNTIPLNTGGVKSIAFGDVDNNENKDLIAATPDGIIIYTVNNLNSLFTDTPFKIEGSTNSISVDVADFDNDGFLDIVFCDKENTIKILYGTGNPASYISSLAIKPFSNASTLIEKAFIKVSDLNCDKIPDFVYLSENGLALAIGNEKRHIDPGNIGFTVENIFEKTSLPAGLEITDLNNDNVSEIITATNTISENKHTISILKKDTANKYQKYTDISFSDTILSLDTGDPNGDGLNDLGISTNSQASQHLFLLIQSTNQSDSLASQKDAASQSEPVPDSEKLPPSAASTRALEEAKEVIVKLAETAKQNYIEGADPGALLSTQTLKVKSDAVVGEVVPIETYAKDLNLGARKVADKKLNFRARTYNRINKKLAYREVYHKLKQVEQDNLGLLVVEKPPEKSTADFIAELKKNPNVQDAEPNGTLTIAAFPQDPPNDPFFSSSNSWGQGYDDLYGLKNINSREAWKMSLGNNVLVAVIDTCIDYTH